MVRSGRQLTPFRDGTMSSSAGGWILNVIEESSKGSNPSSPHIRLEKDRSVAFSNETVERRQLDQTHLTVKLTGPGTAIVTIESNHASLKSPRHVQPRIPPTTSKKRWTRCLSSQKTDHLAIQEETPRRHTQAQTLPLGKVSASGSLNTCATISSSRRTVQQLYSCLAGLGVNIRYHSGHQDIGIFFHSVIRGMQYRLQAIDLNFVRAHGIPFLTGNPVWKVAKLPKRRDELMIEYARAKDEFLSHLDNHIARTTRSWMEPGALIAISNCNAQLEYAQKDTETHGHANVLMKCMYPESDTFAETPELSGPSPSTRFNEASKLAVECDEIISRRYGDPNILPYLNVLLNFRIFLENRNDQQQGDDVQLFRAKWNLHAEWVRRTLPWTDELLDGRGGISKRLSECNEMLGFPSMKIHYRRAAWCNPSWRLDTSPEADPHPSDFFQSEGLGGMQIGEAGCHNSITLLLMAHQKFVWLAALASIIVPVISSDAPMRFVNAAAWAFSIPANVPSLYVLANPPLSSTNDGGTEDIVWKLAKGWSVSFGPVFSTVLVMLLRAKLPIEKREAFLVMAFVISVLGILILMLGMRDGTWSVLDMLALCVSFCAISSYMIVDGIRGVVLPVQGQAV